MSIHINVGAVLVFVLGVVLTFFCEYRQVGFLIISLSLLTSADK